MGLIFILLCPMAIIAGSFSIDERKVENVEGIKTIVFELDGPSSVITIDRARQSYLLRGGKNKDKLELTLNGFLDTSNKKSVPSLLVERKDSVLVIRIFKKSLFMFQLIQKGSFNFEVVLPESFEGDLLVRDISNDIQLNQIEAASLTVNSSSGDVFLTDVDSSEVEINASSGDITASDMRSDKRINFKASSGDIDIDQWTVNLANLSASSGYIRGKNILGSVLSIDASSGRIELDKISVDDLMTRASSGKIKIAHLSSSHSDIFASSGNVLVGMDSWKGNMNIKSSSGDVLVELPSGSKFNFSLNASSGKIKSDFKLLTEISGLSHSKIKGEANGGGYELDIKASSGDITIKELL